jgi:hypothetical protein
MTNGVDNGLLNPKYGKTLFKNKPKSIIVAKPDPMEKIMISKRSSSFKFKILSSVYPGMRDNQRNPSTCLSIRISNKMDKVKERNSRITVLKCTFNPPNC